MPSKSQNLKGAIFFFSEAEFIRCTGRKLRQELETLFRFKNGGSERQKTVLYNNKMRILYLDNSFQKWAGWMGHKVAVGEKQLGSDHRIIIIMECSLKMSSLVTL